MHIISEIKRKVIHFFTILIPILYSFSSRKEMLYLCGVLIFFALLVELARWTWSSFSAFFDKIFFFLLRDNEKHGLTGATFIFLGLFLSILLFDKNIAQTVMMFIIISDAFSAIMGQIWGNHKIYGDKTLEGSLAYCVSSLVIVCLIIDINILIGVSGIIASLAAEIFITRIDDNVTVAVIGGGTMQVLSTLNIC
ncbi:MAG: hypothetical protein R6V04_05815 [bacterium]